MVSTVLFVSGVTTLLHTSFGSRLPLIQGPSFIYLAPALAIINSPEFQGLNGNVCLFAYAFAQLNIQTIWHSFFFVFFVALEPVCLLSSIQDLLKRLNMAEFQAYHEGVTGGYNNRFNLSSNSWI